MLRTRMRTRGFLAIIAYAYTVIGLGLLFKPDSFAGTPSYANLLELADQRTWATLYLLIALVMWVSVYLYRNRLLAVVAHTIAFVLCAFWLVAFLIRAVTNPDTTVVNPTWWSVAALIIILSALQLDSNGARQVGVSK
jgi:peptidoglycan/LPS O-acetylase OafA/YrhL